MYRWLIAIAAGIVVGWIVFMSLASGIALAAFGLFLVIAPIDILTLPRTYDQRVGSVDVLWVLATLVFFPWGSLAWFLFGRPPRRREHERQAAADRVQAPA